MEKFIQKYDDKINGVLNGFDRLVFRGRSKVAIILWHIFRILSSSSIKTVNSYIYSQNIRLEIDFCQYFIFDSIIFNHFSFVLIISAAFGVAINIRIVYNIQDFFMK